MNNEAPVFSFDIPHAMLKAMALFQSGDDTRAILCSTLFEIKRNGMRQEATLVATNGRLLSIVRQEIAAAELGQEIPEAVDFSIDLAPSVKIPKPKDATGNDVLVAVYEKHAELRAGKFIYRAPFVTSQTYLHKEGATFPNWRAVLPTEKPISTDRITFNAEYLKRFSRAAKLLNKDESESVQIATHGDEGAMEIHLPGFPGFFGLLMPMKSGDKKDAPEWVKSEAKKAKAKDSDDE